MGQVLQFDDEDELTVWPGKECNKLRGTDSTIFAPLMKPSEGLWTYSTDLCRALGPQYQRKVSYNGLPALRYTMDFGDVKVNTKKILNLFVLQNFSIVFLYD